MVVFDSNVLLLVLDPKAKPPTDPGTGLPVEKCAERVEFLIKTLSAEREKIVIPTPVLCEILVHSGDAMQHYLETLNGHAVFRISPFDQKAAVEAAIAMADALKRGGKRIDTTNPDSSTTKIKFDRQIVAIAKVEGAHAIYSDDDDVHSYGTKSGLKVHRTVELDLPPEDAQGSLDLPPPV